jgi:hypothetical protein
MAKITLTQQVADLTALVAELIRAQTPVAAPAPKAAEAKSAAFGDRTFTEYVAARRAAAVACEIHPALDVDGTVVPVCNRSFSPASTGRTNHVARIV